LNLALAGGAAQGAQVALQEVGAEPGAGLALELGDEVLVGLAPFGLLPLEAFSFQPLAMLAFLLVALRFNLECALMEGHEYFGDFGFDSLLALVEPARASWVPGTGGVDSDDAQRPGRKALGSRRARSLATSDKNRPGVDPYPDP